MTQYRCLVSTSPKRRPLLACVDACDEAEAAFAAALSCAFPFDVDAHPWVRIDGDGWIVSNGHATHRVTILNSEDL